MANSKQSKKRAFFLCAGNEISKTSIHAHCLPRSKGNVQACFDGELVSSFNVTATFADQVLRLVYHPLRAHSLRAPVCQRSVRHVSTCFVDVMQHGSKIFSLLLGWLGGVAESGVQLDQHFVHLIAGLQVHGFVHAHVQLELLMPERGDPCAHRCGVERNG